MAEKLGLRSCLMFLVFLVGVFGVGVFGVQFEVGQWYDQLAKPWYTPPGWVFGPVWTVLYVTIAFSGWLVWWRSGFVGAKWGIFVYVLQLVLNGMWSWLFFGLHRIDLALLDNLLLCLSVLITMVLFIRHSLAGALLLLPYLFWLIFALVLNFEVWCLNR